MRTRHYVVVVLAVVLAGALLLPAAPAPAAPPSSDWSAPPTGVAGHGRIVGGEWVWQDFVYDDGGQLNNEADIVEVRTRPIDADLNVRVTLNSLLPDSAYAVGVAVEDVAASVRDWPDAAAVGSRWMKHATATPDRTRITTASGTSDGPAPLVDYSANTIEFTMPQAATTSPRLVIAAGRWDATNAKWSGRPADLAFNLQGRTEPFAANEEGRGRNFRNAKQQAAINAGDVSAFVQAVDVPALRARKTQAVVLGSGRANRVYRSRQSLGEGYGTSFPRHRGLYQPYAIHVPTSYDGTTPVPLAVVMHSLNNIHNEYDSERVYEELAEGRGAIAITPLALGVDGWYWDLALVDTLDAWADARRHYSIDDRGTTVSGYSMGGYGSWRLSTLLPDRIAAAAVWAGVPAYQIWAFPAPPVGSPLARTGPGNTFDQLENTRHIPFMVSHGVNDELVPVAGVTWQTNRLHQLQHSYRYQLHPGYGHGGFRTLNDYSRERAWLTGRTRVEEPGRVTFAVRPDSWVTPGTAPALRDTILGHLHALAAELGGDLRSSHWVRDVHVPDGAGAIGRIDLNSSGRAHTSTVQEHAGAPTSPSAHTLRGLDRIDRPAPTANRLVGTLAGVTEVSVDLTRAGLSLAGLELAVTTDRATTLRLREGATTRTVQLEPSLPVG